MNSHPDDNNVSLLLTVAWALPIIISGFMFCWWCGLTNFGGS
jgi:hypothetical protein